MNTTRTLSVTAAAALTVGLLTGGALTAAASAPRPAFPGCAAVALQLRPGTADRLERAVATCVEAAHDSVETPDRYSDVLSCRLLAIIDRPFSADTIDRRLAACSFAQR